MGKRVLVIDDDAEAHSLVTAVLEPLGYEVRRAMEGVDGLRSAEAEPPDIILLDLQMPRMDGCEVCRILRCGLPTRHIPVIMVTASDDPALNRMAYAAGAQVCVPKPIRQEGLVAIVHTVPAGVISERGGSWEQACADCPWRGGWCGARAQAGIVIDRQALQVTSYDPRESHTGDSMPSTK